MEQGDAISRMAVLDAMPKSDVLLRHQVVDVICNSPSIDVAPVITGETSDGYHTFNELYHHRAVLFSVIVKAFPDRAWKARKHHDGSMYDGMFIVGIETPDGQATYHYDIDPYWDMFKCKELEYAPEWDGHTPAQAIARIGKLEPVRHGRWISVEEQMPEHGTDVLVLTAPGTLSLGKNCVVAEYIHPRMEKSGVFINFYAGYDDKNILSVTHWMPLPEPPKEGLE